MSIRQNKLKQSTIVLASNNSGKLKEFQQLISPLGFLLKPQSNWSIGTVAEPHKTFVENALAKARYASEQTGHAALADDSGICVDALKGLPGVLSARYAQMNKAGKGDAANNTYLLTQMQGIEQRTACFVACLVFVRHACDPMPLIAQGVWWGKVAKEPLGENGFGYDPIFWLPSFNCTAAQLSTEQKNTFSHRAIALRQLVKQLGQYGEFV